MEELPEELQLEILSWLPGKSLARCNWVCRLWDHSFTCSAFLFSHSRSSSLLSCTNYYARNYYFSPYLINFVRNDDDKSTGTVTKGFTYVPLPTSLLTPTRCKSPALSNLCNGLVCLFNDTNSTILLFSVRTEDFLVLPGKRDQPLCLPPGYVRQLQWCSLGFDPVRSEYRVLRCISGEQDNGNIRDKKWCSEYEILIIGSKSWKPINHMHVPHCLLQGRPYNGSFCLDGVIYWVHTNCLWNSDGNYIARFDLASEKFHTHKVDELVGCSYHKGNDYYLTPIKGCATLFFREKGNQEIHQWTLSNYPDAVWTRKIFTSHVISNVWDYVCWRWTGRRIILKEDKPESMKFSCYDLETNDNWVVDVKAEQEQNQVSACCAVN